MSYAIGIVTYQPNKQRLQENIKSALSNNMVGNLIIVDNNSSNLSDIKEIISQYERIILIKNDENMGVAHALNQILKCADEKGFDWVLTLDQDSVMAPNTLNEYNNYTKDKEIGIICPCIEDRNMGREYTRPMNIEYINLCITAGNLVRIEAWKRIGGYSEELFIDGVDFDFCLKMHRAGYKILRINTICLLQEVGHGHKIPLLFHHQISVLHHSPIRLYYIARNYLYIGKKHKQKWHWSIEVLKRMFIVLCFEQNRWEKLNYMIKGVKHSQNGIYGKYPYDINN